MTRDEIKNSFSMSDILIDRYGILPDRRGFIPCPFHQGDREPSMKIYKDGYKCFACNEAGDIFDFVQKMDDLSFSEAFLSMGGTYEKPTYQSKLAIYKADKARKMRIKEQEKQQAMKCLNNELISAYRAHMERVKPLTDAWCDCYNALQYQLYLNETMNERRR